MARSFVLNNVSVVAMRSLEAAVPLQEVIYDEKR